MNHGSASKDDSEHWRSCTLKRQYKHLFENKLFADVIFVVGKEQPKRISANKIILSAGSCIFEAMLAERWSSENNIIAVPDIEPAAFEELIRFIYCREAELNKKSVWLIMDAAQKYMMFELKEKCIRFLKQTITEDVGSVLCILENAALRSMQSLIRLCLQTLEQNTSYIIDSSEIKDVSLDTLKLIIEQETLDISEMQIFRALHRWIEAECGRMNLPANAETKKMCSENVRRFIRLGLISENDFKEIVDSGVFSEKELSNRTTGKIHSHFKRAERVKILIRDFYSKSYLGEFWVSLQHTTFQDVIELIRENQLVRYPSSLFLNRVQASSKKTLYSGGVRSMTKLDIVYYRQTSDMEHFSSKYGKRSRRFRKLIPILIETPKSSFVKYVFTNQTVKMLKIEIQGKIRIPTCRQNLSFEGTQLDDIYSLRHFNIKYGSKIILTIRNQKGKMCRKEDIEETQNQKLLTRKCLDCGFGSISG